MPWDAEDPGLRRTSDAGVLRRSALHVLALLALIAIVAVTRAHGGEYRAVGATGGKGAVASEVMMGSILGPLAAAQACVRRPWQQIVAAIHHSAHAVTLAGAMVLFGVAVALSGHGRRRPTVAALRRAAVFGAVAVGVSYLLCFTHYPPTCEEGQSTSVHTAAVIGAAGLAAAGFGWLASLPSRRWAVGAVAFYFGLLFGHAVDEQGAFASLWHERQAFWSQVLNLCPDLPDGTVILCDGAMPQRTWYMPANLWSDAMVPAQVYQFPASYRLPPLLAAFPRVSGQDWRTAVQWDGSGRLVWRTPPCNCPAGQALTERGTILLRVDNAGQVSRVTGTVDVAGHPFRVRAAPPSGTQAHFPTLPFFDVLTRPQ
jgi:hypothetical protein